MKVYLCVEYCIDYHDGQTKVLKVVYSEEKAKQWVEQNKAISDSNYYYYEYQEFEVE